MKYFLMPRGSGKTEGCVDWLMQSPDNYLIVANEREARRVRDVTTLRLGGSEDALDACARVRSVNDRTFFTVRPRGAVYAIDNVSLVLAEVLGVNIEFGTDTEQ